MPTLTAIAPTKNTTQVKEVTMELVPATHEDLKYIEGWSENGGRFSPITKLRTNMVYWMYSSTKKELEPTPYLLTYQTDLSEFNNYLKLGMIFIAKNPFL